MDSSLRFAFESLHARAHTKLPARTGSWLCGTHTDRIVPTNRNQITQAHTLTLQPVCFRTHHKVSSHGSRYHRCIDWERSMFYVQSGARACDRTCRAALMSILSYPPVVVTRGFADLGPGTSYRFNANWERSGCVSKPLAYHQPLRWDQPASKLRPSSRRRLIPLWWLDRR